MKSGTLKWWGAACVVAITALLMGQGCPRPSGGNGGDGDGNGTPPPEDRTFLGAALCQECHSRHYNQWSLTAHAGALETLKRIGQDTNAECLECHVVGHGQEGGFVSEAATPALAGVQCENCHGPGGPHRANVDDESLRPPKSIASGVCGTCHNDAHHPTFDEWSETGHAAVSGSAANYFTQGRNLNNCGFCHSGEFRIRSVVHGEAVPDTLLQDVPPAQMEAVTCAVCHDPHANTGNAVTSADGEDYQLRHPEVTTPDPTSSLAENQNSARFNLCGQCHRSRDTTWTATARPPHHSIQANFYTGEMPVPDGTAPLLPNQRTAHRFVEKQCVTCHMPVKEFEGEEVPADSGHRFQVGTTNCTSSGCHPSEASVAAETAALQAEIQAGLDEIAARLGPVEAWQYTSEGGPANQDNISDDIKKIRFLYHWVLFDGSHGVHNPPYARAIIADAKARLALLGK